MSDSLPTERDRDPLGDLIFSILCALEKCHEHVGTTLIEKLWQEREKWEMSRG